MTKNKGSVEKNILQLLENRTHAYENRVALGIKTELGWEEHTYKGLGTLTRRLACYLIDDIKLQKGERIAILSESKPEFGACVLASVLTGTTTVPLDVKLTEHELNTILSDCLPTVIFTSLHYLDAVLKLKEKISSIQHIILMDKSCNHDIVSLHDLPHNYETKWRHRSSKSTALIIYTSGTTGAPKGVEITFGNVRAQLEGISDAKNHLFPNPDDISVLSILPMNHLFELTVGFSVFLYWGLSIYYTQSLKPKEILTAMKEKNIKFMIVVPAFLKLLKSSIESEVKNSGPVGKFLFNAMFKIAKYIPNMEIRKLMFKKVHDKFGGKFGGCISGGAPLDVAVGDFFERLGIKVYHGYGLSETSPVVCVNYDKRTMHESVGRAFRNFEAKTDETTGELMLRGPSVMKGYYNRPDLTKEVLEEDGWLHTGDIAKIDKDGFIFLTGRIKSMIVLSGGKKVFPEEVESVLEESPLFAEVCVFGATRKGGTKDGTEEIVAVVVPSEVLKSKYADENQIIAAAKEEVKQVSLRLASYKRPVNVIVQKEPLPRTTTRKVKRMEVKKALAQ